MKNPQLVDVQINQSETNCADCDRRQIKLSNFKTFVMHFTLIYMLKCAVLNELTVCIFYTLFNVNIGVQKIRQEQERLGRPHKMPHCKKVLGLIPSLDIGSFILHILLVCVGFLQVPPPTVKKQACYPAFQDRPFLQKRFVISFGLVCLNTNY